MSKFGRRHSKSPRGRPGPSGRHRFYVQVTLKGKRYEHPLTYDTTLAASSVEEIAAWVGDEYDVSPKDGDNVADVIALFLWASLDPEGKGGA